MEPTGHKKTPPTVRGRATDRPGTWAPRRVWAALASSNRAAEFSFWFILLALPTLAFKCFYLVQIYGGSSSWARLGLGAILDSMGTAPFGLGRYLHLAQILSVDVLEMSLFVAALVFVGGLLTPARMRWFVAAIVLSALLITGLNATAVRQLGKLLTADTLAIAVQWARDHHGVFVDFLTPAKIAFLVFAVLWSSSAVLLPRLRPLRSPLVAAGASQRALRARHLRGRIRARARHLGEHDPRHPPVLRGYWSSALASLRGAADPAPCAVGPVAPSALRTAIRSLVGPRASGRARRSPCRAASSVRGTFSS